MFKSIDNTAYEHPDEDCITRPSSKSSIQSPRDDNKLRFMALILASFLVFGNDYCYDLPQALETQIQDKFGIGEVQYNLLYSVYSMPNIILPFFGGYLLDYFGIKVGVLLFNFLIIVGQGLFTFGSYGDNYLMLIIGRSVFGIGAECLNVAQSTIVTMWFKNKELSTALGISLCICRLGSSLNSYLSPLLFDQFRSIGHVSAFGMVFLIISLVCGFGLIKMDSKYLQGEKYEDSEKISLKDIKSFKPNFWILYVNGILCFMSFFSFLNISNKYIQRRFMLAATVAGGLLTIPYVVGGILTPILSSVIDRKGKKATLLMLACLLLSYNHFTLSALGDCDGCLSIVMPLILFGVFFAFYTSLLIPCVSIISEERVMGTAMGIIYSGQNTGLAIGPLLVGSILSDESNLSNEYTTMSIVLAACSFVAFLFAVANWWYDKYYNKGILQKGMKELETELHERKFEIEITDFEL